MIERVCLLIISLSLLVSIYRLIFKEDRLTIIVCIIAFVVACHTVQYRNNQCVNIVVKKKLEVVCAN